MDPKDALKEFGIEHQLQLARPFRWLQIETLGLLVLRIRNELEVRMRGYSSEGGVVADQDQLEQCLKEHRELADTGEVEMQVRRFERM